MSERRTALVTGGTRGIGLGIARALARDGWSLALCGMRAEADVIGTLETLRQDGARVSYDAVDLASREHVFVNGIEVKELDRIVQVWADACLQLRDRDLKVMQRLVAAQDRLLTAPLAAE